MASDIEPRNGLTEEAALNMFRASRNQQNDKQEEAKDEGKNEEIKGKETIQEVLDNDLTEEYVEEVEEVKEVKEVKDDVSKATQETQGDVETVELDVEQISSLLGIDPDYIDVDDSGKINIKTDVNGEIGKTTLKDLLKNYQIDAHLTKKGQEIHKLDEQRKQILSEFVSKTQSFATQTATILDNLKQEIVQPLSAEQLQSLRESDPAEYAARKEEQRERESRFARIAHESLAKIEEAQKAQSEEMQRQYATYIQEQGKLLEKNIPNIRDEIKNIASYAKTVGFSDQEINQIADARIFTALHKAMLYEKGISGAKQKLSKPMPKVIKPSARVNKGQVAIEDISKKRAALKKSGNIDDALALLKSMRK